MKMKFDPLLIAILVGFVVLVGMQVVQLAGFSTGGISTASAASSSSSSSGSSGHSASVPSSLQNLPQMVGGC